jgi:hypothetical protein
MYCPKECPQEKYNQLANDDIGPPEHVVIFGFPLDIGISLKEPRPLGCGGIVALKTNEEFIRAEDRVAGKLV